MDLGVKRGVKCASACVQVTSVTVLSVCIKCPLCSSLCSCTVHRCPTCTGREILSERRARVLFVACLVAKFFSQVSSSVFKDLSLRALYRPVSTRIEYSVEPEVDGARGGQRAHVVPDAARGVY